MAITQVITTLPAAPDPATMTRDQFSTAAAASVLAQKAMVPELNTWTSQVNAIVEGAAGDIASGINGASAKTTPVDADLLTLTDSAASFVLKKFTWANLKTTLASTFSTLTQLAAAGGAALVGNTPAGSIAATTVQAAIDELDSEKAALAGSATQVFNVEAATADDHAVSRVFGDARYAPAITTESVAVAYTSPVSITTGTQTNITSLALGVGVWMVHGMAGIIGASGTSTTTEQFCLSATSATRELSNMASNLHAAHVLGTSIKSTPVPSKLMDLSGGGATVYLVTQVDFSVSTLGAFGNIVAVKIG